MKAAVDKTSMPGGGDLCVNVHGNAGERQPKNIAVNCDLLLSMRRGEHWRIACAVESDPSHAGAEAARLRR
jgi:hypothetical protein